MSDEFRHRGRPLHEVPRAELEQALVEGPLCLVQAVEAHMSDANARRPQQRSGGFRYRGLPLSELSREELEAALIAAYRQLSENGVEHRRQLQVLGQARGATSVAREPPPRPWSWIIFSTTGVVMAIVALIGAISFWQRLF